VPVIPARLDSRHRSRQLHRKLFCNLQASRSRHGRVNALSELCTGTYLGHPGDGARRGASPGPAGGGQAVAWRGAARRDQPGAVAPGQAVTPSAAGQSGSARSSPRHTPSRDAGTAPAPATTLRTSGPARPRTAQNQRPGRRTRQGRQAPGQHPAQPGQQLPRDMRQKRIFTPSAAMYKIYGCGGVVTGTAMRASSDRRSLDNRAPTRRSNRTTR
jgi:hypothetical protein